MTVASSEIPVIHSIDELGSRYAAWLVDIWGVMHNGHRAHAGAVAATRSFRGQGGVVVLLSNAPRPSAAVEEQLRRLGVPDDAYDAIVTSGDLTRHELAKHGNAKVFHLGPERDRPIFEDLAVRLVAPEDAELVVCTGLFDDETETPADYAALLGGLASRELSMICANPDHLVERGDRLVWCAGALAALYEGHGGSVVYAGKPHAPIYQLAFDTVGKLAGRLVPLREILAIGDGVMTDIAGATGLGLGSVFVASGLHAPENGDDEEVADLLDARHLEGLFAQAKVKPLAAIRTLVW
jgi:HAD superfamily hydrolase (TIGR01459 family)